MRRKLAEHFSEAEANFEPMPLEARAVSSLLELGALETDASPGRDASIPQEVVHFATFNSLHRVWLQRAILREAAKRAEPMRQLEQWTHESLRSIKDSCAHYDREVGPLLHSHSHELAEQFWNEVRARAARLHDLRLRPC